MKEKFEKTLLQEKTSIYVTHGSISATRGIAKHFNQLENEVQVIAHYDKSQYFIHVSSCFITKEALKNQFGVELTNSTNSTNSTKSSDSSLFKKAVLNNMSTPSEDDSSEKTQIMFELGSSSDSGDRIGRSIELSDDRYKIGNLNAFICFVQSLGKPIHRVSCDVNLGSSAGHWLTQDAHLLIKKSKANQVVFITSTPETLPQGENYLRSGSSIDSKGHEYILPLCVKQGCIVERGPNIKDSFSKKKHETPAYENQQLARSIIVRNYSIFKKAEKEKRLNALKQLAIPLLPEMMSTNSSSATLTQENQCCVVRSRPTSAIARLSYAMSQLSSAGAEIQNKFLNLKSHKILPLNTSHSDATELDAQVNCKSLIKKAGLQHLGLFNKQDPIISNMPLIETHSFEDLTVALTHISSVSSGLAIYDEESATSSPTF